VPEFRTVGPGPELHRLLLRVAGHAPDHTIVEARYALAEGRMVDVARTVAAVAANAGLVLTEEELALIAAVDPDRVGALSDIGQGRQQRTSFTFQPALGEDPAFASGATPPLLDLTAAPPELVGVLTDEHLQTNVPGIYAAGDCAEAFDKVSGTTIVSAIQPNAAEQARVAALNMVGKTIELKGVTQINVLDTLGMISASFGKWDGVPGGQHVELTDREAGRHLSLQFSGDQLVGCNSIGWTNHVGVMRGLVEGQVRLGEWKDKLLEDPTLLMAAYLASAQAQHEHAHV